MRSTLALGVLLLAGCGALPPTGLQRAQQTAQDFNVDARFARKDAMVARIDEASRDEYALRHKSWGGNVRIADMEVGALKAHGDADVDVLVHVSWYRMDEQELRMTTLQQSWHSKADAWLLVSEKRVDGDVGLLGETVVMQAPAGPRPKAQFPTIRLTGNAPD